MDGSVTLYPRTQRVWAREPGELTASIRAAWDGDAYPIAPGPFSFKGVRVALAPGVCIDAWRSEGAARARLRLRADLLHIAFLRGVDLRLRGWGIPDMAMAVTVGAGSMALTTRHDAAGVGLTVAMAPMVDEGTLARWRERGRDGTVLLPVAGEAAARLHDHLRRLVGEADLIDDAGGADDMHRLDADDTAAALQRDLHAALQAAIEMPDLRVAQSGRRRHALAAAAEELIWSRVRSPEPGDTSLDALCAALGTTRRTLQLAFQDHFGVNFGLLTRAARLQRVRHELRAGGVKVSDTAFRHGFEHLGRFAGYYREFFGENPSATRRARSG